MSLMDSLGKALESVFGGINPTKFRQNLMLLSAESAVKKQIWPVLDQIGEARFRYLIDNNQPFLTAMPLDQLPPKWQEWIAMAPQFKQWTADIPDGVLIAFLPPWLQNLIGRDDKSMAWWMREVEWIRQRFEPGSTLPAARPGPAPPRRFVPAPAPRKFIPVEVKDVRGNGGEGTVLGESGGGRDDEGAIGAGGAEPEVGDARNTGA